LRYPTPNGRAVGHYQEEMMKIAIANGVAIVVGFAALTAPATAGADQNPYAGLGCNCRVTTPLSSAALRAEIERGIRDGLTR
jgi:hypothetical protein